LPRISSSPIPREPGRTLLDFSQLLVGRQNRRISSLQFACDDFCVELSNAFHDVQIGTCKSFGLPFLPIDISPQMAVCMCEFMCGDLDGTRFDGDTQNSGHQADDHPVQMYFRHPEKVGTQSVFADAAQLLADLDSLERREQMVTELSRIGD